MTEFLESFQPIRIMEFMGIPNENVEPQKSRFTFTTLSELYSKLKINDCEKTYWQGATPKNHDSELGEQYLSSEPHVNAFEPLVSAVGNGFNAIRFTYVRYQGISQIYEEGNDVYLCVHGSKFPDIQEEVQHICVYQDERRRFAFKPDKIYIADWRTPHHRVILGDTKLPLYSVVFTDYVYMLPVSLDHLRNWKHLTIGIQSVNLLLDNDVRRNLIRDQFSENLRVRDGNLQLTTPRPVCDAHTIYFVKEMAFDFYKFYNSISVYDMEDKKVDVSVLIVEENRTYEPDVVMKLARLKDYETRHFQLVAPEYEIYKAVVTFEYKRCDLNNPL